MASAADAIFAGLDGKSNVKRVPGYFRGMDGNRATVDFGGGRVPADMAMDGIPPMNEPIWVLLIDNRDPVVIGYAVPKPGVGTVVAVGTTTATVSTVLGEVEAGMLSIVSPGDQVLLTWNELGVTAIGPRVTTTPPGVDPGAPGGGPREFATEFHANQSGSWRGGRYWTPQVRAGDTNLGVWAGGTKIPNTIPASAAIKSVEIYLSPVRVAGSAPVFALHSLSGLDGAPGFGPQTAVSVPGGGGWVTLPTDWGDKLKAGGGYLWVGINHGGDSIFNSVPDDGQSGTLRIRYTA